MKNQHHLKFSPFPDHLTEPDDQEFLKPTKFCDFHHPSIEDLSGTLAEGCSSTVELAVKTFYWVRDNVNYCLGQSGELASDTLRKAQGSCSHKANLLVGLLRANGIPASFRLMRVKTREYLGPVNTGRFQKFMSEESCHIFSSVKLAGRWLAVDASDDRELSENTQHINPPSKRVDFDGASEATLHLDPKTIILSDGINYPDIDNIMGKKARLPAAILAVFNLFVEFMRTYGRFYSDAHSPSEDFFSWLLEHRPEEYANYRQFEGDLEHNNKSDISIPRSIPMLDKRM